MGKETKSSKICKILQENAGGPPLSVQYIAEQAGSAESTVINVVYMNPSECEFLYNRTLVQTLPDATLITTQTGNHPRETLPDETVQASTGGPIQNYHGLLISRDE